MSCRTTPFGSLATTFNATHFNLPDATCTSMFHQLRREHVANPGWFAHVTDAELLSHIDLLDYRIQTSTEWATPAARNRAQERLRLARSADLSAIPQDLRHAFLNMFPRGASASRQIMQQVRSSMAESGLSEAQTLKEFRRIHTNYSRLSAPMRQRASLIFGGMTIADAHRDEATAYAMGILAIGQRCSFCGQFQNIEHECPPANRRPLRHVPIPSRVALEQELDNLAERIEGPAYATPEAPEQAPEPAQATAQPDPTPMDMTEFQELYDAARARIAEGQTTVPVIVPTAPGEVTNGLGSREGGNSFGIELEIDFPDDPYPFTKRQELARRLYNAGIAASPYVEGWHHVGQDRPGGNYTDNPNGWICEFDRSVDDVQGQRGVEIKSQILYDEPQTWQNISQICTIIDELGGRPTFRTGMHINVGGSQFDTADPAAHNALLKLAAAYDDTLIRLAHNPASAEWHRGRQYCNFVDVPPEGYRHVDIARNYSNHYQAFNLGHLAGRSRASRVEVRIWDGAVDAGRIQAAVTTSLALVQLAHQRATPGQAAERSGRHREVFGSRRTTGEQWEASTESFRRFVGLMDQAGGVTPASKQAWVHLFAESRWQKATNQYAREQYDSDDDDYWNDDDDDDDF